MNDNDRQLVIEYMLAFTDISSAYDFLNNKNAPGYMLDALYNKYYTLPNFVKKLAKHPNLSEETKVMIALKSKNSFKETVAVPPMPSQKINIVDVG